VDAVEKSRADALSSRVAIVTGSGQGLGRAFAKAFARHGATAVVADLNGAKAMSVVEEIRSEGGQAIATETDIADPDSTADMARHVLDRFGRIDILVNNAAIFSTLEMLPSYQISAAEWSKLMDANITGAFHCCRAVVEPMMAARWGRIINISSASFHQGRPNYVHHTSKAALVGMTRSMARELGFLGITVNAVLPGATPTEIERKTVTPAQRQAIIASQCISRSEKPEDPVGTVLFLASNNAEFLTGQSIVVDGGPIHG
jgi:3-oxoacyl-[acyl-carrier protein] reductase